MTDDPTTDVPDQPDERDEHVAELLEVPPLDDVTRRRLVSRALEAAGETGATDDDETGAGAPAAAPRGRRILAVAAGAVAVIAVGAGVISALRDDGGGSGSTTVAGRVEDKQAEGAAPSTGDSGEGLGAAEAPAPDTEPASPRASANAGPIDLGDLGDVGDTARLRATVRGALAGADPQTRYLQDSRATPCTAAAPPPGTSAVAVGTGRDQGTPVVVLVVAEDLDRFRVLRLDPTTCAVKSDDEL